jgi:hypothetical protein
VKVLLKMYWYNLHSALTLQGIGIFQVSLHTINYTYTTAQEFISFYIQPFTKLVLQLASYNEKLKVKINFIGSQNEELLIVNCIHSNISCNFKS